MDNRRIAKFFWDIASVLEISEENVFRVRSYQRAAQNIENYPDSIEELFREKGKDGLEQIPGIGESIAAKIEEIINHGSPSLLKELHKKIPAGVLQMMEVRGIGPKFAKLVFKKLKTTSVSGLEKAAKDGSLLKLPGVEQKKVRNILKAIGSYKAIKSNFYIGEALPLAESIVKELKEKSGPGKVLVCGSLRRFKETIGDIDILVAAKDGIKVAEVFTKLPQVKEVTAKGDTKSSVMLDNGMNADLRVIDEAVFGAASHYFTGSKQHNIKMRQIAQKKGLKLSEYGLSKGKKVLAAETEEEIFKALGMQFIPPEIREDSGEIELAQKRKLPALVELSDIKGDLHVHTKASDGSNSIEEIAERCRKLGYSYVAITDHSVSSRVAGGLSENALLKQCAIIDSLNKTLKGFRVLKGAEVDILPTGKLDFDDDILAQLDIVIASVHSNFGMKKEAMTERVIKALQNKHVTFIAHPTGRLLNKREPYEIDIEEVILSAAKLGKALELNAYPDRLDLNAIDCRLAKEKGVKIAVNTDSHALSHFSFMRYGIGTARRGWLEKKDIINTRDVSMLLKK